MKPIKNIINILFYIFSVYMCFLLCYQSYRDSTSIHFYEHNILLIVYDVLSIIISVSLIAYLIFFAFRKKIHFKKTSPNNYFFPVWLCANMLLFQFIPEIYLHPGNVLFPSLFSMIFGKNDIVYGIMEFICSTAFFNMLALVTLTVNLISVNSCLNIGAKQ